jgi:hypothetical protein
MRKVDRFHREARSLAAESEVARESARRNAPARAGAVSYALHAIPVERQFTAHAEKIAAHLVIEIVVEGALVTVFEQHAHKTRTTDDCRRHFFNDRAGTPLFVRVGIDAIAKAQVEALFLHGPGPYTA